MTLGVPSAGLDTRVDTSRLSKCVSAAAVLHALVFAGILSTGGDPGTQEAEGQLLWLDAGAGAETLRLADDEGSKRRHAAVEPSLASVSPETSSAARRTSETRSRNAREEVSVPPDAAADREAIQLLREALALDDTGNSEADVAALGMGAEASDGERFAALSEMAAENGGASESASTGRASLGATARSVRQSSTSPLRQLASRAHGPRLQPVADPCHGMFPRGADHDEGSVVVALEVTPQGKPAVPRVLEEFPRGEGFAAAARACLPRLRFEPAADEAGHPVVSKSVVRLRFHRG